MKLRSAGLATIAACLTLWISAMIESAVAQGPEQGPLTGVGAPQGGPGGGPPPGKEAPVTVPPTDLNPVLLLADGQLAFAKGRYEAVIDDYANPIINYYAYRYGTRGRRMFVAHDAAETATYVATGARALNLATDDGVLNGAALPPAEKGSRNIVVPEGTLPDAFALKARALVKLGKIDEALQMLGRSTVLSPNFPAYWNEIAELYAQAKRCEDAVKAYAQAEEAVKQMSSESVRTEQAARAAQGKLSLSKCQ